MNKLKLVLLTTIRHWYKDHENDMMTNIIITNRIQEIPEFAYQIQKKTVRITIEEITDEERLQEYLKEGKYVFVRKQTK